MKTVPSYIPPSGKAKIVFIGEAPGVNEVRKGKPFVGWSGVQLNKMLKIAGIVRGECMLTNVFDFKLPGNDLSKLTVNKKEVTELVKNADTLRYLDWSETFVQRGQYVPPELASPALDRLRHEIESVEPNVLVPLGQTALWAVMRGGFISKSRGNILESELVPGVKVIPTFHPAYLIRNPKARIVVLGDLNKAEKQSHSRKVEMPTRELWLAPELKDLWEFEQKYIKNAEYLSVDIETFRGQVECIGFAPDNLHAIVVPFVDRANNNRSYWYSADAELEAMQWCKRILEDRTIPKVMQNGPYDVQWLWEKLKIKTYNYSEDTRLLHHALYPELPKSLAFLGSAYENEKAWKSLRTGRATKRDD